MFAKRRPAALGLITSAILLLTAGCGGTASVASSSASVQASVAGSLAPASKPAAASSAASAKPAASGAGAKLKIAMILPGPIQDADYNAVGYQALQEIKAKTGAEVSDSEQVAVADAERVAREYLASGNNVIIFHGGQFLTIVTKLAKEFPNAEFVMESSGKLPDLPANVWNIGRKYYQAYYPLGVLGAAATKSNHIGYIAGTKLPDFVGSLNSIKQAIKTTNPKADVVYTFTGDQNDQVKARETAASQINSGVDFIIVSVNNAVYGVVEAAKSAAPAKHVLVTTYYTDKSKTAPDIFTASLLTDFTTPYLDIVDNIGKGVKGGYEEMRPGHGFQLSPITNVSPEAAKKAQDAWQAVVDNKIDIPEVVDKVVD